MNLPLILGVAAVAWIAWSNRASLVPLGKKLFASLGSGDSTDPAAVATESQVELYRALMLVKTHISAHGTTTEAAAFNTVLHGCLGCCEPAAPALPVVPGGGGF